MTNSTKTGIVDTARMLLKAYPLCDTCLGRQFAWLSTDTTNRDRGSSIKSVLCMVADEAVKSDNKEEGKEIVEILAGNGMFGPAQTIADRLKMEQKDVTSCHLCSVETGDIFSQIPDVATRIVEAVECVEFSTFLIGCNPIPALVDREDELRGAFGLLHGETLKSDYNRELGKYLADLLERPVDFDRPDLVVIYDMQENSIKLQINPIFVYGRYRKLVRGIPQSRWDCSDCKGKGCDECNQTGRRYPDSISEYVGIPAQRASEGSRFKFHAAGREDVDVLMLGSGRPFVVELSEPRIRTLDLSKLQDDINRHAEGRIEVHDLEHTDRKRGQSLKADASENFKEYVAKISTQDEVSVDTLKQAEKDLKDVEIEQRTPVRVFHRRSDLIRKKRIYEVTLEKKESHLLEGFFKVQGGTYVKELISGDEGRTIPSISEKLGTACTCIELNVTAIYGQTPDPNP
ncbi:MAG: tRNA pseudouridine(54/55) synthase Pus10 [Candidatus Thorarchaeota archaeon]